MLIENSLGEFSDAQDMTSSEVSDNVIDLAQARHQVGVGGQLWLWLRTNVAADFTTTDETYLFAFEVDTVENFASPRCVLVVADSDGTAIVTGDPESTPLKTAGKTIFAGTLPYGVTERYGRWTYVLGGTTPSITLDAQLLAGPPPANESDSQVYVSNITVPS